VSDLRAALLDCDVFDAVPPLFHYPWNSDAEMLYWLLSRYSSSFSCAYVCHCVV